MDVAARQRLVSSLMKQYQSLNSINPNEAKCFTYQNNNEMNIDNYRRSSVSPISASSSCSSTSCSSSNYCANSFKTEPTNSCNNNESLNETQQCESPKILETSSDDYKYQIVWRPW